ncbi:hypothetical protein BGZ57DRAFT_928891 [Hyaloscypha finlandica]|nr:hypothetical protein BGZ57DRAFT_928891 [Hyaloscypha finlandica]KAH8779243.1 hypothetical protein F5882DRAFT_380013 [Hyaloscypha sp. PMI_1271]
MSFFGDEVMKMEPTEKPIPTATSTFLEEWKEVESGHYEYILDDEPTPKPRVVFPAITKGIINTCTVQQLQENLEKAEIELKRLKENVVRDETELQQRLQAQMEETLQTMSENMKDQLNQKLAVAKEALQKERLRDLSSRQITEFLGNPTVVVKMKESLAAVKAEEAAKLDAQFQFRVEAAKRQLSDDEIQELLKWNPSAIAIFNAKLAKQVEEAKKLLSDTEIREMFISNPTAKAIFRETLVKQVEAAKSQLSQAEIREMLKSNPIAVAVFKIHLNKQLNDEKAKIVAAVRAEFEGKEFSVKEESNAEKANADVSGEDQTGLRLGKMEDQLKRANAKLSIVEKAAEARPSTTVKAIWREVEQLRPAVSSNSQISFGAGISRLTTPFRYPITALGSSTKATSPVIFGQTSKPRGPLEVLSNAFPRSDIQPQVSPKTEVQSGGNPKVKSLMSSGFKRLRESGDVGGSEEGTKKFCKEIKE